MSLPESGQGGDGQSHTPQSSSRIDETQSGRGDEYDTHGESRDALMGDRREPSVLCLILLEEVC